MLGDLFDSPWKVLIVAIVIIVIFGSRKLPDAARSLGKSMRILKTEVSGLHEDEAVTTTTTVQAAPAQLEATSAAQGQSEGEQAAQAKIDALSKQLADLQQTVSANGSTASANGSAASANGSAAPDNAQQTK